MDHQVVGPGGREDGFEAGVVDAATGDGELADLVFGGTFEKLYG